MGQERSFSCGTTQIDGIPPSAQFLNAEIRRTILPQRAAGSNAPSRGHSQGVFRRIFTGCGSLKKEVACYFSRSRVYRVLFVVHYMLFGKKSQSPF